MTEAVVDCIVITDGTNPDFFSYMPYEQAQAIQQVGLSHSEQVILRETPDRKIPDGMKNGEMCITDILVRLEPNISVSLN